jgi:hypothetical protein
LGMVDHTHNPSCSGGGDGEDHGSRPAWAKSSRAPISIKAGCGGVHMSSQLHRKCK